MGQVNFFKGRAWSKVRKIASSSCGRYQGRVRRDFLAGILIIVPLAVTVLILKWLFQSIDGILSPAVDAVFGRHIPGIGFGAIIVLIYLAGLFTRNALGWRILQRCESLLEEVPIIREIYSTARQILESVMLPHEGAFKEVVLVEFPRPGMRTIGFITNRLMDSSGQQLVNVYIPTTPNPTSGHLEIIPEDDVCHIDMPVDEAIKMVVSGGTVSPDVIQSMKQDKRPGFNPEISKKLSVASIPPQELSSELRKPFTHPRLKKGLSKTASKAG
jgi:uncharacterized membrane protein